MTGRLAERLSSRRVIAAAAIPSASKVSDPGSGTATRRTIVFRVNNDTFAVVS